MLITTEMAGLFVTTIGLFVAVTWKFISSIQGVQATVGSFAERLARIEESLQSVRPAMAGFVTRVELQAVEARIRVLERSRAPLPPSGG